MDKVKKLKIKIFSFIVMLVIFGMGILGIKIIFNDIFKMEEIEYLTIVREINIYYLTLSVGLGALGYLFQEDIKKIHLMKIGSLILFSILLSFYSYIYSFAEKHIKLSKVVLAFNTILIAGLILIFILHLYKKTEQEIEMSRMYKYIEKIRKLLKSIGDGSYTDISRNSKEENEEEYKLLMLMKDKDLIEAELTYGYDELYFIKQDIKLKYDGHEFLLKLSDDNFLKKLNEHYVSTSNVLLIDWLRKLIEDSTTQKI